LTKNHIHSYVQFIKSSWESSSAWPDFIEAMRLLLPNDLGSDPMGGSDRWMLLPGLCCQASGGRPESTREVSAAWLLLYIAAHLVDSVEDGDPIDEIKALGGPGSAINVANGFFLSAAMILNELSFGDQTKRIAHKIRSDFYNTILIMTSGQHRDINYPQLSLEQWWQVAEAKSGSFFSLACRSGAQFGTQEPEKINAYSDYGFHLGMMLQIRDDIDDLKLLMEEGTSDLPANIQRSLAFSYAMEVLPDKDKSQLNDLIEFNSLESESINPIIALLNQSGTGLYLLAEMEKHYELGAKALEGAGPSSPVGETLLVMMRDLKLN
jgi:geranylgeranyl pyrophosphate synthase